MRLKYNTTTKGKCYYIIRSVYKNGKNTSETVEKSGYVEEIKEKYGCNKNENSTLIPLENKILSDFELSRFVVCTDASLSSTDKITDTLHETADFRTDYEITRDKAMRGIIRKSKQR